MSQQPPQDQLPQDWRDLLVRLDQKVTDGFTNLTAQMAANASETRDVKREVDVLKTWQATITGQMTGFKAALIGLVALMGFLGWEVATSPQDATQAHSVAVSAPSPNDGRTGGNATASQPR